MSSSADLQAKIALLLEKSKLSTRIISLQDFVNGGNNRTYLLETVEHRFVVKKYFRKPGDERDRLRSEFAFLSYAKRAAPQFVPSAYGYDEEQGLALYEYLEGSAVQAHEITEREVNQASQFFCALNNPQLKKEAQDLPLASEAGFSIQKHVDAVSTRLKQLQHSTTFAAEDEMARQFVAEVQNYWQLLLTRMQHETKAGALDLAVELDHAQRCISPSDFGFHNALKMTDGSIRFLDFEYAGWDDPAKMVGDFFLQLAVPVAPQYYDRFVREVMAPFPQAEYLQKRASVLYEVCRVKWCCIALNIFIPVHLARRQFANPHLDVGMLKKVQLEKAQQVLRDSFLL